MHLFSRRGGATHFSLGDFNVVVAPTPVAEEMEKRIRRGILPWWWGHTALGNLSPFSPWRIRRWRRARW